MNPEKTLAIIQARMGSSRLPEKVLIKIEGKSIIEHIVERVSTCKEVDKIIVATTTKEEDNEIEQVCNSLGVECFRGDENNVLQRFIEAAKKYNPKNIVRLTGDNPLIDTNYLDSTIKEHKEKNLDYTSSWTALPYGLGSEVVSYQALIKSLTQTQDKEHLEHVTLFITQNPGMFKIKTIDSNFSNLHEKYKLSLDTKEDLKLINEVFKNLYRKGTINSKEIINLLENLRGKNEKSSDNRR